jgi:hypothetical protein
VKGKLIAVAVAGGLAALGAVWLAAHGTVHRPTEPGPLLTLLVGASLIGCGLAYWHGICTRFVPAKFAGTINPGNDTPHFAVLLSRSPLTDSNR